MGEVVSKEELIEVQKADGLRQRVLNWLASGVACTGNADGFDAYLLGDNGLLLGYIPPTGRRKVGFAPLPSRGPEEVAEMVHEILARFSAGRAKQRQ